MSSLILHRAFASPPARSVVLLAKMMNLNLQYRDVNLIKGEGQTPEFKKLNPMGTVPVLQDGEFTLSESHAILKYLLIKYGDEEQKESLYPADLQSRASVDQAMFFNCGFLFKALINPTRATLFYGLTELNPMHRQDIEAGYAAVNAYTQQRKYIAANRMTLADISVGTSAYFLRNILHNLDSSKYPYCAEYISRMEELPLFKKVNDPAVEFLVKVMNMSWENNKKLKEGKQ